MTEPVSPPRRRPRSEPREVAELRALRDRQPALSDAVDLHLELLELQRRIQARVPLPTVNPTADVMRRHEADGTPLLRYEDIPIELTDLRLCVRQTADVLRRFGAIDEAGFRLVQALGRDAELSAAVRAWYGTSVARRAGAAAPGPDDARDAREAVEQVLTLAIRPFVSRCAEILQPRPELSIWTRGYCPLCAAEPDFAVITPAAERHLICGRCLLRWRYAPLACPFCGNADRSRIASFATPEGLYRVYACTVCRRYLKAYDARRSSRPVMPIVDLVATLPLDAAAMQRGYVG